MECFADGGDDRSAPAEFAGEVARIGDSAAGSRAFGRRIGFYTEFTEDAEDAEKNRMSRVWG